MSIAVMSRIRLVGLNTERNKILDTLQKNYRFEARATNPICDLPKISDPKRLATTQSKLAKIAFAIDFLSGIGVRAETAISKNKQYLTDAHLPSDEELSLKISKARIIVKDEDFYDVAAKEYELMSVCDELDKLSKSLVENASNVNKINQSVRALNPYRDLPINFSTLGDHKTFYLAQAYHQSETAKTDNLTEDFVAAVEVRRNLGTVVTIACELENKTKLLKRLGEGGFTLCPFDFDGTAADRLNELDLERAELAREELSMFVRAIALRKNIKELKILYDIINLEAERIAAESEFLKTESAFVLEGWVPERVKDEVKADLESVTSNVYIEFLRPKQEDMPPTLAENPKLIQPFESITNMYSAPKYREIDPNTVMGIFFFIFFGIMIGDAGYGFVLTAVGLALGLRSRMEKGTKSMMLLIGICGISAIAWGVIFGGYFAIDFGTDIALWFNPMANPMNLLILSVVLGCLQLAVGYIIKGIKLCQQGKPFSAIFDSGFIVLLILALGCLGLSMTLKSGQSAWQTAAIVLAIIGIVGIVLTAGRQNKGVIGKVTGAFSGLYGLVGLFSDILSYLRIFGLGLASGAIGLAFNTLGSIFFGSVFGYFIGIPVLILLHVFNIGIGVLGAYVHNARLQFLEFYGKFYDGEGRLFSPLGERTKYTRFN